MRFWGWWARAELGKCDCSGWDAGFAQVEGRAAGAPFGCGSGNSGDGGAG